MSSCRLEKKREDVEWRMEINNIVFDFFSDIRRKSVPSVTHGVKNPA